MTLDQLIEKLQTIRRQAERQGWDDIPVLFRDPAEGVLYDEIMPYLTEVFSDNLQAVDAFDMQVGDFYVEI